MPAESSLIATTQVSAGILQGVDHVRLIHNGVREGDARCAHQLRSFRYSCYVLLLRRYYDRSPDLRESFLEPMVERYPIVN